MKKFLFKLVVLVVLVGGVAFVLSALFNRDDEVEAERRAEATGIEGMLNRAVDGAKSAIRREADEALANMKDAARAKAEELKQRAKDRAEELKDEAREAIKAKAQDLTEEAKVAAKAKMEELADDLSRSVQDKGDDGLKKLGEGIKERVSALTDSFSETVVTRWESDSFQEALEAMKSGRMQEALEKLSLLNQEGASAERNAEYDALRDDVAAFAAQKAEE